MIRVLKISGWKCFGIFAVMISMPIFLFSQSSDSIKSLFIHRITLGTDNGAIIHTNSFLKGDNLEGRVYNGYRSVDLSYSFRFPENSMKGKIYGSPYQGIGLKHYFMNDNHELGNPFTIYIYQGARIARISEKLNLNYEWNFGLSGNWLRYDAERNPKNQTIGSKINAYIHAGVNLNWRFAKDFNLDFGPTITHFSNGNTQYPNKGLNIVGVKAAVTYEVDGEKREEEYRKVSNGIVVPKFKPFIDYDLLLFGSWRKGPCIKDGERIISPGPYGVVGVCFAPMYNFNYRFRAGVSLDMVYDSSLSIKINDLGDGLYDEYRTGSFYDNVAMGLSARGELVMPYFTISAGVGYNFIENGRDSEGTYQILALKYALTKNIYLNTGYKLRNLRNPNFLMLGIGFRFSHL